ncbi:hypothetical protein KTH81_06280 [Lachnospiraceae bacterium ASD3451]|nr:hypothetical protein [Diplocloster agilis]MBU9743429.1 hypothetical protein [Diplocloster agilis]
MDQLIIDGTAVYELDEECICRKKQRLEEELKQQEISKRRESGKKSF